MVRPAAVGVGVFGPPGLLGFLDQALGATIVIVETVAFLGILGAALFGSETISERGFRVLRWIAGRAEPPAPLLCATTACASLAQRPTRRSNT